MNPYVIKKVIKKIKNRFDFQGALVYDISKCALNLV